jgi:hypothetical protein
MVYYAPHVGVSKQGTIGELLRIGQSQPSGCCGAARAALKKLEANEIAPGNVTELDYQMNTIEQLFFKDRERILAAPDRLREATEVMYEHIHARVGLLSDKTAFRCKYVILVGAILINGDFDMGSFNEVRHFTVCDLQQDVTHDVFDDYMRRLG